MNTFGFMAFFVLVWAWMWPEAVGRYGAEVVRAYRKAMKDDPA